ncbi:hypothetical protein FA15DRAFT_70718 [Coprinopsis marcescibilis]|uniref:Uncharacterized protein n=1 Tax=Coprinopsis marcescibilis TaxID=230819 RepID=A0A5C3KNH7_COPMA|nr:hypothetical protein FA15DRAFT_70718 [Coprinopsis marcescibilis]
MPPRKKPSKDTRDANQEAHFALVLEAAQLVVKLLRNNGFSCATFGSLASKMYGSARCPKDVDMLVLQDPPKEGQEEKLKTAHEIKTLLLDKDPRHFYLTLPRDPQAEYRILWYRQEYRGPECKVDILVPGTMHLPRLAHTSITWIDGVPLVPFSLLLLHKLQGWDDHRLAEEPHKQRKQGQDAADLRRLAALTQYAEPLEKLKPWNDEELFSEEFQELTKRRVKDYCQEFPTRAPWWRSLGFDVGEIPDPPPPKEKKARTKTKAKPAANEPGNAVAGVHPEEAVETPRTGETGKE